MAQIEPKPATDLMHCVGPLIADLSSTLDQAEVFRKVGERLERLIGFDAFAILLLDDDGRTLRIHHAVGFPSEVVAHCRFELGRGVIGGAMRDGVQVRVDDCTTEHRCAGEGMCAELAVPLVSKGRAMGILDLRSRTPNRFTDEHQRWLEFCAGPLANAIENARLYERINQQTQTLALLHELSRELTSILDTERLLRRVAEAIKRTVDFQVFTVMRWNEETRLLDQIFNLRYDQRFIEKTGFRLGYGLTGTAAALRQPVRVANVDVDPRYVSCGHGIPVRSELVVPLLSEGRLIGVIDLESTQYDTFTEQHEQTIATLATSVAIALENARLYEKLRGEEQRLERDLETARQVQQGLLPALPATPGLDTAYAFVPAEELGGDFYDVLRYGDGRTAFAIGDVAGKGTAAALYGSVAVGMVRGHAMHDQPEPAEMMRLMNEHLRRSRISDRFLAMAFAVFDARDRSLTIASAGFPRPWLLRGATADQVPVEGVALGLLPQAGYTQRRLVLEPGDMLVFCSDGFDEAMDGGGEQFGQRRLRRLLESLVDAAKPDLLVAELLAATDAHTGNRTSHDDRTVVALRVS